MTQSVIGIVNEEVPDVVVGTRMHKGADALKLVEWNSPSEFPEPMVLLVSSDELSSTVSGLDLYKTSCIILGSSASPDLMSQLVGRAARLQTNPSDSYVPVIKLTGV